MNKHRQISEQKGEIVLRDVKQSDLPIFYEHQLDSSANYMAAFTARNPADKAAFTEHWNKIMADESVTVKTILYDGEVAGHVVSFKRFGNPEVSYWIGKEYWGKGIATQAFSEFLNQTKLRPLYARAAKDNNASLRVLEKCGFAITGEDKGYSNARGKDVEEFILVLGTIVKEFFAEREESRQIFEAVSDAIEAIGPAELRISKSQISFRRRKAFASVWMPSQYVSGKVAPLVLTLSFRNRSASPRWKEIVEPAPGRFTHHLELYSTGDIDDEVRAWLQDAWKAAD